MTRSDREGKRPSAAPKEGGERRGGGLRAAGPALIGLAEPALRKRGFVAASLIADWPDVVGPDLAQWTLPERLAFPPGKRQGGTLHLRVAGARAIELQHLEPLVLERINGVFGYAAVARLAIRQAPLPPRPRPRTVPPRPLEAAEEARLAALVGRIADDRLRRTLERLGRAVLAAGTTAGKAP